MVVFHIASIENNPFNGVCVAVPQHVIAQKKHATVGLINIRDIEINDVDVQIRYEEPFVIGNLPAPFNRPDIVVFHECYRPKYLGIAANLRKNGIPYVVMPHGELRSEAQQKKWLKKKAANFLLFNRFVNKAAAIQCLSADEMKFTRFGKRKFIGTNGTSIPSEHKTGFREKGIRFIYIGRYEWRVKGLDILFDAISRVSDVLRREGCLFELYGPDSLGRLDVVRQLVSDRGIEDLVSLNHEIQGEEKKNRVLDADIFVQTSRHEGMPMGILEALSYGLPCMVTEGTTLAEQVEEHDAGWNAGSTAESVAASIMQALLEVDTFGSKSKAAVSFVRNNYSWDTISKETVDTYRKLAGLEG